MFPTVPYRRPILPRLLPITFHLLHPEVVPTQTPLLQRPNTDAQPHAQTLPADLEAPPTSWCATHDVLQTGGGIDERHDESIRADAEEDTTDRAWAAEGGEGERDAEESNELAWGKCN